MHMNLKPNKHKRISFNTMTMASLGFIGTNFRYIPLNFLCTPLKLGRAATMINSH